MSLKVEVLSRVNNYPKKLCTRYLAVLERTQKKTFVKVFIVKRLADFQEGKNGTKILLKLVNN
jgi:hypothetical protein